MFKISKGNSKLGSIYNINLPAVTTCNPKAPCKKHCYARKGTYGFPNVKKCYEENLKVFLTNPLQAEADILMQLPHVESDYFTIHCRLHSSGDFVNMDYLKMIIRICEKRPYIKFMAYTKQYSIFNIYVENGGIIPSNLKIIFSYWEGLEMDNIHNFPIAVVEEFCDKHFPNTKIECDGKCDLCYKCWNLKASEMVVFRKH